MEIFHRAVISKLEAWKSKKEAKPLILRGARQVGKTTAVNIFSKQFDQYIYLNLDLREDRQLFEQGREVENLIKAIFLHKNEILDSRTSLIFIDEIQNSPQAISMMRYFYESFFLRRKNIRIIAAGSLLESIIKDKISFPVGRVEYEFMHPMTFRGFLGAMRETALLAILDSDSFDILDFSRLKKLKEILPHEKLLQLFRTYMLIGGMPEVVKNYVRSEGDMVSLKKIYQSLLTSYLDDISKYASTQNMVRITRHVAETAPFEAGKRIKFQGFGNSNYRSREVKEALQLLEKSMLINLLYPSSSRELPLIPNFKRSPKLQFLDTGLVNYFSGLQISLFSQDFDKALDSNYKGRIVEHIVAQELLSSRGAFPENRLHFWTRENKQSNAEVDFLIPRENSLIPIEVKSGKAGTLRSLHQFIDTVSHNYAVRFYERAISIEDTQTVARKNFTLINLPYYLAGWV